MFYSFADEMVKIAGVGIDIHGYSSNPDKPPKKWIKAWEDKEGPIRDPEDEKWMKADYADATRIKTPNDLASSRGSKMHLFVLQGLSPGSENRRVLHKPSKFMDELSTDLVYQKNTKSVNLRKPQIRALLKDYQSRRQSVDKEADEMQDAFVLKTKALLANPKLRVARVEYE